MKGAAQVSSHGSIVGARRPRLWQRGDRGATSPGTVPAADGGAPNRRTERRRRSGIPRGLMTVVSPVTGLPTVLPVAGKHRRRSPNAAFGDPNVDQARGRHAAEADAITATTSPLDWSGKEPASPGMPRGGQRAGSSAANEHMSPPFANAEAGDAGPRFPRLEGSIASSCGRMARVSVGRGRLARRTGRRKSSGRSSTPSSGARERRSSRAGWG